jgi:hypothetical protein
MLFYFILQDCRIWLLRPDKQDIINLNLIRFNFTSFYYISFYIFWFEIGRTCNISNVNSWGSEIMPKHKKNQCHPVRKALINGAATPDIYAPCF